MSKWTKKGIFFGKKRADGTKRKEGVVVVNSDGVERVLLTPAGKGAKYANELKNGKCVTNSGAPKLDDNGKQLGLSAKQRSYRAGCLQARKDSAAVYKAKKKGGKK